MGNFPEISWWEKEKTSSGELVFRKEISHGPNNMSHNLTRSD